MTYKLVVYFGDWIQYCQARSKFLSNKINSSLFTYFNFAFGQKNLKFKSFLSTGNWNFNSCDYTPELGKTKYPYILFTCKLLGKMLVDPNDRTKFIKTAIEYAKKYGFDGVDLYWEYSNDFKLGGQNADYDDYLKLLKELLQTAKKDFIITITSAAILQETSCVNPRKPPKSPNSGGL